MKIIHLGRILSISTLIIFSNTVLADIKAVFSTPYISVAFTDQHRPQHRSHASAYYPNTHYANAHHAQCNHSFNSRNQRHHKKVKHHSQHDYYRTPHYNNRHGFYQQEHHYDKPRKHGYRINPHNEKRANGNNEKRHYTPKHHTNNYANKRADKRTRPQYEQYRAQNTGWISAR